MSPPHVQLLVLIAVYGNSWFEHVKTWHDHEDDVQLLFITYEEMIQVGTLDY